MYLQVYHADVTRRPKHFGISCEFSRNRWQQRAGPTHRDRDKERRKKTSARVRSTNQYDKKYTKTKKKRRNTSNLKNKKKDAIKNNDIEEQKKLP